MKQAKKIAAMKAEKSPKIGARQGLETSLRPKEPGKSRVTPSPEQQILVDTPCVWNPAYQNNDHKTHEERHIQYVKAILIPSSMAPHSSTLAWKILWMEKPGRLQSMGSLRVRHN